MDIVNNQIGLLEGKKSNEYVEALITYSLPNIKNLEFNGAIVIQGDQSNKDMIILSEMGNLSLLELTKKGKLESVFLRPIQEVELSQSERKGLELLINQIGADEKTKVSLRAFFNSSYKQYYETLYMYIDDDFIVEALLKIKDEFLLKEKRDKVKINLLIIDLLNIFSSKMKYVDFDEDNTMEKISHSYDLLRDYVHRSDVTNDDKINLLRKYKESINKFLIDEDEKDELNRKISIEIDKIKKI